MVDPTGHRPIKGADIGKDDDWAPVKKISNPIPTVTPDPEPTTGLNPGIGVGKAVSGSSGSGSGGGGSSSWGGNYYSEDPHDSDLGYVYFDDDGSIDSWFNELLDYNANYLLNHLGKNNANVVLNRNDRETFTEIVTNSGPLDIKMTLHWTQETYIFQGKKVTTADLGNFNYGYVGSAAKIDLNILALGSAKNCYDNHGFNLERWWDEVLDQFYIEQGAQYYKNNK